MPQSPFTEAFSKLQNLSQSPISGKPLDSLTILESLFELSHAFTGGFRDFIENLLLSPFWQSQNYPANPFPTLSLEFASLIDSHCKAAGYPEPSYHSRKHFQDVCLALTALLTQQVTQSLNSENQNNWNLSRQDFWVLLFCAMAHDFGHDGSINKSPFELEKRTIANTRLFLGESKTDATLKAFLHTQIEPIILATDPTFFNKLVTKFQDESCSLTKIDCLCMLMVEADLLASALPGSGKMLTELLSREWMLSNPAGAVMVASNQGRLRFLEHIRFISPHAKLLNLEAIRKLSIEQIKD